jgi:hypothetical protein
MVKTVGCEKSFQIAREVPTFDFIVRFDPERCEDEFRVPPLRPIEKGVIRLPFLLVETVGYEKSLQAASSIPISDLLVRLDELATGEFGVQSPATSTKPY